MSLKNKTFLAWCDPPAGSDHSRESAVIVFPLYELQYNSYLPSEQSIPSGYEKIRIQLRDLHESPLEGSKFVESGHVFEVRFNEEPEVPKYGNGMPYSIYSQRRGRSSYSVIQRTRRPLVQVVEMTSSLDNIKKTKRVPMSYDIDMLETEHVLLRAASRYYGPFKVNKLEDGNCFVQANEDLDCRIGGFDSEFIDPMILRLGNIDQAVGGRGRLFDFIPFDEVSSFDRAVETYDWMPDEQLVQLLLDCLQRRDLSGSMEKKIRSDLMNLLSAQGAFLLTEERSNKLLAVLTDVENRRKECFRFVNGLLGDEEISQKLLTLFAEEEEEKRPGFLKELVKEKLDFEKQIQDIQQELETKKAELEKQFQIDKDNLEADIRSKRNELEQVNGDVKKEEKELAELQKSKRAAREEVERENKAIAETAKREIEKLEQHKKDLLQDLGAEAEAISVHEALAAIQKQKEIEEAACFNAIEERERQERPLLEQQRVLEELKSQIRQISSELREQTIPTVADRLHNLVHDDIWKEIQRQRAPEEHPAPVFDTDRIDVDVSPDEIIDRTLDFLRNAGRKVSRNDVVNYLVCLTQGFVTTFAGDPGAGKTSLCNLLAKALGLAGDKNGGLETRRFSEISVERGWASHKDFIGYFNPLSKRVEKSNAEVYDAFSLLSREAKAGESPAPYFFLLDEANLSPIEHYWAPFLRLCDFDSTESRSFNLGGDEVYLVPETVRFLATVNFDHTTEPLSPRFLNRSWIIMLNPADIGRDALMAGSVENAERTISYESLRKAFPRPKPEEGDGLAGALPKWKAILKCFEDAKCGIMPRSRKMVQDYVFAALKLMDLSEGKLAPLDYAVAQKILPLVGGNGKSVEKLVKALKAECDSSLPRSAELLQNMIDRQENGFFQFFSH